MPNYVSPFQDYTDEDGGEWQASDAGEIICKCILAIVLVAALLCVMWPKS